MKKTRKFLAFLLAVIVLLTAVPLSVSAVESTTDDGFTYTVEGGECTITGYTGKKEKITIPAVIDENKVTAIAENAFYESLIESVVIPEGIVTIGNSAFRRCLYLTSVSVPSTVTSLPDRVFYQCIRLSSVTFPGGNNVEYVGEYAFYGAVCGDDAIGPKLTTLAKYAFSQCLIPELTLTANMKISVNMLFTDAGLKSLPLKTGLSLSVQAFFQVT